MVQMPLSVPRRVFVTLALVAAALLLLRPVCDLWIAHAGRSAAPAHADTFAVGAPTEHGSAPAVQCCASASEANLVAPLHVSLGGSEASQAMAPPVLVAVVTGTVVLARQLHWLRAPPRTPQSFYLRSTRIAR